MSLSAHVEPTAAWRELRAELRRAVGESTFDIWLAALELRSAHDSKLVVDAPAATCDWVSKRYGRILESSAKHVFGNDIEVEISTHGRARASRPAIRNEALDLDASALNPRYSFDQFIIGDSNRLAHAAALAVAELPGQAYNPLFLHAPPGLGKTHLVHAIGNYIQAFGDGAGVRYTTAEAFTNQFITALGSRSVDRFKRAYRDPDVLLIDDVQFLASKAKTEEEFFHTFNAVYETGRQLVVTCDRLPRQLVSIEERLRERFESGLVAVIRPPDFATRVAILRKRAVLDHIRIEDDAVLELIATRVTDNVRVLEGALIRVVAYHSFTQLPIDVALAQMVLDEIHPCPQTSDLSIEDIQRVVAGHYGLAVAELISSSRAARVSWPRQLAIHLARDLTGASLHAIGEAFGGRNHATVLHACKRVEERVGNDQQAVDDLEELTASITSSDADRPR
ncbi:MAG TPA: chromosomal replication initiator protein DnaA [Solirubrobacteraceae bacterium]|nr:chromosomal replication initiator protein DnaA [Solirubrobacteraceae bacterium]